MSSSTAFNDEKGGSSSVGEPEYGHDPASGGIFSSDYKRYEASAVLAAAYRSFRASGGDKRGAGEVLFLIYLLLKKCFQSLLMHLIRRNRKIGKLCLL